jgi:hypothetical protein
LYPAGVTSCGEVKGSPLTTTALPPSVERDSIQWTTPSSIIVWARPTPAEATIPALIGEDHVP